MSPYKNCMLCPRHCGVDREAGQVGYCKESSDLRIAFAGIHRGEEPPVTGAGGSGTIFISGCNLGCAFCQNYQISQKGMGRIVSTKEFAEICLALDEKGAENINIVTGSHTAPAIALGIRAARKQGLKIPVLWNSSGYDGKETLEILKDVVDVYLPDLKTLDPAVAARFFNAPDYPERATAAILKMMEYRELNFGSGRKSAASVSTFTPAYLVELPTMGAIVHETLVSGVMIRHLVLPGYLESTYQVLRWFSENCMGETRGETQGKTRGKARGNGSGNSRGNGKALLSLMTQYTPVQTGSQGTEREIPGSYISEKEYEAVLSMLEEFGIDDGYCQELVTGSDWLPDFRRHNPFSSELSVPVWHCSQ